MPIATSRDRKTEYILKADRGAENHTVFLIGVLTHRQKREIESLATKAIDFSSIDLAEVRKDGVNAEAKLMEKARVSPDFLKLSRDAMDLKVRYGIKGWRNFLFDDGKPVPCVLSGDALSEASFEAVSPWVEELAAAVDEANTVTKDDVKN